MKIEIRTNAFWIYDYVMHNSKLIYDLTITDQITNTSQKLYDYDQYEKILKIPRGVGIDFVKQRIYEDKINKHDLEFVDMTGNNFYKERNAFMFDMKEEYKPKDSHQEGAINFLVSENNINNNQKFLTLNTGFGKTFCAIYAASILKLPVLVISRNLSDQWIREFLKYTKLEESDVMNIVGSKHIEIICSSKNYAKKYTETLYVTTIDTLRSFKNNKNGDLNILCRNLGIGIKIFDEAHLHYVASTNMDVNMNTKYTWYLTATPGRSQFMEDKLFKRIFVNIPFYGEHTHKLNNHYNLVYVSYNSAPKKEDVMKCMTIRGFNSKFYAEYIFRSNNKVLLLYGIVRRFIKDLLERDPDAKSIIILDRLVDIETFYKLFTTDTGIDASVGKYCTLVDKSIRHKELESNIILSTIGSIGAGRDIKKLKSIHCLSPFSSPIITKQILGRLRNIEGEDVYYYDYIDEGFPPMKEQRKGRMKELKPRSKTERFLVVNDEEVFTYIKKNISFKK